MYKGLYVRHVVLIFILLCGSNLVFALSSTETGKTDLSSISPGKINTLSHSKPVFTFSAGASSIQAGKSQSFAPLDECRYTYIPKRSNSTNMLWGGFIGSELKRTPSWLLISGLGYYQPNSLIKKGSLIQGADPASNDTYSYSYQTQTQQLLAEGKLYWVTQETIQPFLQIGIGAAFNKLSDYQTNVPPFLEFTPFFSNHSQTNFTYTIGSGIDISLSKSFRLGVAYRFTDLGLAKTGSAQIDGIPISSTLKQSHLIANQILTQFTYTP